MVMYIRTIAQLPYPRSERVELFADAAEDLDDEQYTGIDRDKIAPGSYCITANGVLYLMNTMGEWVLATSGGGSKEPVLEALSVTENGDYIPRAGVDGFNNVSVNVSGGSERRLSITPTIINGVITDQESIDILNTLEDNYINGDGSYVLDVSYTTGQAQGNLKYRSVFRSFFSLHGDPITMFGTSACEFGNDLNFTFIYHMSSEEYGMDIWGTYPNLGDSNSNEKSSPNSMMTIINNIISKYSNTVEEPKE